MIAYNFYTANHYNVYFIVESTTIDYIAAHSKVTALNLIKKAPPNWLTLCKHYRDVWSELTVARRVTTNYINVPEQKPSSYG